MESDRDQSTRDSVNEEEGGPEAKAPSLRESHWHLRYSSEDGSLAIQFYSRAIRAARSYDRASGYFRSSALALGQREFAEFAINGGQMRLVCSPDMSEIDLKVVQEHLERAQKDASDRLFEEFLEMLGEAGQRSGAEMLAAMLDIGALEIRLAVPLDGDGIFHDKFGIITDAVGDRLSFAGSVNETRGGWRENFESFEVFTSWGRDEPRIDEHQKAFDRIWRSESAYVSVFPLSTEVVENIRSRSPGEPRDWLRGIANGKSSFFTTRKSLLPHQSEAIANWNSSGSRGIFKHATGSGKTITALEALRPHISDSGPGLIVVPSVLLLDQWQEEISAQLGDEEVAVLAAGGNSGNWRPMLRDFSAREGPARLIVATVDTASSPDFLDRVQGGDHLMIVADEVHSLGAAGAAGILEIDAPKRLGLSATPERFGDPEGTKRIFDYFGPIVPPEITINDAIAAGRLCRYQYHPHYVALNDEEIEDWSALTKQISQAMAREGGGPTNFSSMDPWLQQLIFKRRRIIKGAEGKPARAAQILAKEYRDGDRWLVYCSDTDQLAATQESLRAAGLSSFEYHSSMASNRRATLDQFDRFGGILVAIKCLDEGVDIPSISHALIAASSQNPREFIQRRGRVLRTSPGKRVAVIHDLLISPPEEQEGLGSNMDSVARAEIARAYTFAQNAINKAAAAELRAYAVNWGLELASIVDADSAEDEDD